MNRVVLDTNVVVSGLLWSGPPRALLTLARAKRIQLFTSPQLLNELAGILLRPKFERRLDAAGVTPDGLLRGYAMLASVVESQALPEPVAPDPDDDWVIATAFAASADTIVSGDKPLLSVGSVGTVRIVGVVEAMELIKAG